MPYIRSKRAYPTPENALCVIEKELKLLTADCELLEEKNANLEKDWKKLLKQRKRDTGVRGDYLQYFYALKSIDEKLVDVLEQREEALKRIKKDLSIAPHQQIDQPTAGACQCALL